ncbi:MAG: class I SAM-dependent methyltransferase [Candidatus Bathyarchaeia archaeon]|nr:class I SAM-dependent methyltransferase [Candidatus Bathyarchaeota archaeon A05DMB-4]MDH7596027.1 class I SAM-dependent methyltransferase [Candidatus Bathyarchaeota archaeon]
MDIWKFYSIREKLHTYCNPVNKDRLEPLLHLLRLRPNSTVLDIACGKGEFLIRLAELYHITGIGVDISPYFIQEAQNKAKKRTPNAPLAFIQLDAKNYKPPEDIQFDLTSCMGATWIWNGYKGTLEALKNMTKPEGTIIVGEPYWLKPPDPEYLKADNMKPEDFAESHYDNVKIGESLGLTCTYTLVSSKQDFDHYETLTWMAITDYAEENPTDPDLPQILERMKHEKHVYLQWQRDTMGWALYIFRKP